MTRKRRTGLSEEDHDLWETVRKSAIPLRIETHSNEVPKITTTAGKINHYISPTPKMRGFEIGSKSTKPVRGHDLAPSISDRLFHAPLTMDRNKFGKMKKGKLVPEARIDLHGMTLTQAHPALTRFILSSHDAGRRLVLVITGKGKHRDDGGPIPVRLGVLKNQVPHWLSVPPLKNVVLQITESHLKHGGTGAYYVYLRRGR